MRTTIFDETEDDDKLNDPSIDITVIYDYKISTYVNDNYLNYMINTVENTADDSYVYIDGNKKIIYAIGHMTHAQAVKFTKNLLDSKISFEVSTKNNEIMKTSH